jgi:DNA-binding transcriptional regulator YiaG
VPNIGAVLKSEISRISRKEIRQETQAIRKASVTYRHEIAALKRHVHDLRQQLGRLGKQAAGSRDSDSDAPARPARFVAKGLRSLRARLGLSAPELAQLIGVSTQSVYNWELKKAVPRPQQLAALTPLRAIGKREARKRVEELNSRSRKK